MQRNISTGPIIQQLLWKICFGLDVGLGYKHNIFARTVYKKIDGKYKQITDWGSSQLMLPLGLKLGFIFSHEIRGFVQYRSIDVFPFNIKGGLPLMSHTLFHIGVSFKVNFKHIKHGGNYEL